MTATQDRPTPPSAPSPATAGRHGRARGPGLRLVDAGQAAAGQVRGLVFGGVARLRGDRPLHPRGATYAARVTVSGHAGSGVPWLDEPATHDATLRVSR